MAIRIATALHVDLQHSNQSTGMIVNVISISKENIATPYLETNKKEVTIFLLVSTVKYR